MPEYLSPGVYVEEVDAGPKPIEGVSTSTAGVIGVTARGPTEGKPLLVTSFADFVRKFGGVYEAPSSALQNKWNLTDQGGKWWRFPLSVLGFFDNGGQRLYVKRVFSATAAAASAELGKGLVVKLAADAPKNATSVTLESLIGIQQGTTLQFVRGDTGAAVAALVVTSYDVTTSTIRLAAALPEALAKGRDFVEIEARQSPPPAGNVTLTFEAKDKGAWGNSLYVHTRPIVGNTFNVLPDPGQGTPVSTAASADVAAGVLVIPVNDAANFAQDDRVLIDGQERTLTAASVGAQTVTLDVGLARAIAQGTAVQKLRPANPVVVSTDIPSGAALGDVTLTLGDVSGIPDGSTVLIQGDLYTTSNRNVGANTLDVTPALVAAAPAAADVELRQNTIEVWGGRSLYLGAIVEIDNGTNKDRRLVAAVNGDQVTLTDPQGGPGGLAFDYYEGHKLRVVEVEVIVEYREGEDVVASEAFTNLRLKDDGTPSFLVNHINLVSKLVTASPGAGYSETDLASLPTADTGAWKRFANGDDALTDLSVDDFVGKDGGSGQRTGIVALEDIDEVSLCAAPNMWAGAVHAKLIQHCEELKDRFAVLDPRDGLSIEELRAARAPIDTRYAALYYPWLNVRDPREKKTVVVAPSAHVIGIYARVDVERGVHKAPANEVIRGIDLANGLAQDVIQREQDLLNPKGINVLRFFPGRGNRVWGARTLSSDPSWKYINVRRLFLFIEESIDEGTQWAVFEPNDRPLWARIRQTITNFLTTQWRNGALQGKTAEEAFFVRCDETTMTQDDIDNGRLICLIGIAPVKPAEFVIFRIQQKTLELQA